ncbi:hypothetical protein T258_4119 (plasmid) [Clostridium sporogenes]|nr:hypothetical protein T258_4119 [Clostridium botulinum Prevot_594]
MNKKLQIYKICRINYYQNTVDGTPYDRKLSRTV